MRNISFNLTTDQIRNRTKTVTRRLGWKNLKPGELLRACRKCQGLKKGEHPEVLATIRVLSVDQMFLNDIDALDVEREGFPGMTPEQFVKMFCRHMKSDSRGIVTRIEFQYV